SRVLGGAVLGPPEIAAALGFDATAVLDDTERRAVARLPFATAELERAAADGAMLVLRLPRDVEGPLTMLRLAERLGGGLGPKGLRIAAYSTGVRFGTLGVCPQR